MNVEALVASIGEALLGSENFPPPGVLDVEENLRGDSLTVTFQNGAVRVIHIR